MSSLMSWFTICLGGKKWTNASKEYLKKGRRSGEIVINWRSLDAFENQPCVWSVE
jgi:hypothetical protein